MTRLPDLAFGFATADPPASSERRAARTACSPQLGLKGAPAATPQPEALQRLAADIGVPSLFLLAPGFKAALPFEPRLQ